MAERARRRRKTHLNFVLPLALGGLLLAGCGGSGSSAPQTQTQSQQASQIPASPDSSGQVQTLSSTGGVDFTNGFFQDFGTNGRDCFSCHRPSDGWTVTPPDLQSRFNNSNGTDEIFRPVDGSNCPNDDVSTLAAKLAAYSQLLSRGTIRVSRPIPAGADFSLTAVDDPYNCVATNGLSLYRRPLPATNLRFESTVMWDARSTFAGLDLFHDLEAQANNATQVHAQEPAGLTPAEQAAIVNFELALTTAQVTDVDAGNLTDQNAQGGVAALAAQPFTPGANDFLSGSGFNPNVFTIYQPWQSLSGSDATTLARQSVARGEQLFNTFPITIAGVAGFNDVVNQVIVTGSCSSCHSVPNVGNFPTNNPMNIGTVAINRRTPDMPLYTFTCTSGAVVQVMDPGVALTTGLCTDIGKFKVPVLRGLAARAPYFHDGQAVGLIDVVNFYNTRFAINLTQQQKDDLVNFLKTL